MSCPVNCARRSISSSFSFKFSTWEIVVTCFRSGWTFCTALRSILLHHITTSQMSDFGCANTYWFEWSIPPSSLLDMSAVKAVLKAAVKRTGTWLPRFPTTSTRLRERQVQLHWWQVLSKFGVSWVRCCQKVVNGHLWHLTRLPSIK